MNYGEIKLGFEEYLLSKYQKDINSGVMDKSDIDLSIFSNLDEFNEYIEKEFSLDSEQSSELIKNINQLTKYEIVDGQLVDPNAAEEEEVKDETDSAEGIDEGTETLDNNIANANENAIVGLLNELSQDESFAKFIDRDEDGEINNKDLSQFYDAIKDYDGDDKSISLEDLTSALEDIKNGKFMYPDEIATKEEEERQKAIEEEQAAQKVQSPTRSGSSGRVGSSPSIGRSSGNNGINSYSRDIQSSNDLETLSVEELEEQKAEKQKELDTARTDVSNVHNGNNEAVNKAEEDCKTKEKDYIDAVKEADEGLGTELETCLQNIAAKESEIDETKVSITEKEGEISTLETSISSSESNLTAMKDALSQLQSQSSDNPEQQAKIESKKSSLQSEINQQESDLQALKDDLATKKDELEDLNNKLEEQETDLEKLNDNEGEPRGKAQIEAEISELENSDAIKQAKEAYETAKSNVETVKAQELEKANEVVATKEKELNEINTKLNEAKAKEIKRENAMDALSMYDEAYGKNLADAAASLHPNSGFGGYCAAGVSDSLVAGTGREKTYGNGCDYTEVMRGRSDFMEYTDFDFNSMNDAQLQSFLGELPAGTVVSFGATNSHPYGHVMIMDGKGNEISDGTNSIGTYYKGSYSSMSVHIPVG